MVFCSSQMLEKFSSHESKTSDLKISLARVMNKTSYSYFRAHSICNVPYSCEQKHVSCSDMSWFVTPPET
jgi:hypothetical protein